MALESLDDDAAVAAKEKELLAAGWQRGTDVPFVSLIGPIWEREEEGGWRFAFLAQPKHRNRRDVVHGGMLMAFADRALGLTARRTNNDQPHATIQLNFQFINAVRVGDLVEASCAVVRRTRFIIFMSAILTVGTELVGTATGIWKTLKPPT